MNIQQHHHHYHETTKNNEKILLWTIRIGLIIALFAPMVFNGRVFFPYIVPRAVFFQITTEILLVLTVLLMAFYPKYRPTRTRLITAMLIYFAVAILTTLTSADPIKSFIGTVERSFGLFHILHYGILFLATTVVLQTLNEWMVLLAISVVLSVYTSMNFLLAGGQGPSLMGNPTFLAAYLVFNTFFSIFLLTKIKNLWLKILLGIAIFIQAWAALATNIRGIQVGAAAAILYLLIYTAYKSRKWRVAVTGLLIVFVASYALIFINKDSEFINKNYIFSRITDFSLKDSTTRSRFLMWRMAWDGFKEKPILGWGRENFSLVFNSHYDPRFALIGLAEGWEDRSHNVVFEELINGGLLQLIAYVFLMTRVLLEIRKYPLLTALLIAYTIQNFFGVDTLNSYLPLFVFLAFCNFLSQAQKEPKTASKHLKPIFAYGLSILTLAAVFLSTFYVTLQPTQANARIGEAYAKMLSFDYKNFEKLYEESKKLSNVYPSLQLELFGILGSTLLQNSQTLAKGNGYMPFAIKLTNDMAKMHERVPSEQRWSFVLGQIYVQSAIVSGDARFINKAIETWNGLLTRTPKRQLFLEAAKNSETIRNYFAQHPGTGTTVK